MEQKRRAVLVALLLVGNAVLLFGQSPRLVPEPYAVTIGKASTPLTVHQLIEASLRFSGAAPSTVASDTLRLEGIIEQAKTALASYTTPYQVGEELLIYLHTHLLTHYSTNQTRIDTLLSTGVFNCVSSAVVYMIVGRALGLQVEGVYTPDHAFCTVKARGKLIDVETTNRYGFDPGTKTAFHDAFGHTGFTYVPPGNYRLRTATDGRGLLSFILQNRMSLLERQYRFAEAMGLAVDRYALLKTPAALHDLASEAGNYCALLNQRGDYAAGLSFLDQVEAAYGVQPKLKQVMDGLIHNRVLKLTRSGQYPEAFALIRQRTSSGALDPATSSSLRALVAEHQLSRAVQSLPFSQALGEVERSHRQGEIPATLYKKYLVEVFSLEAQRTASSKGYLAAVKVIDQGIQLAGQEPQLVRGRGIYLNNYVATVHNQFARLFNNHQYAQARQVLDEGLKVVPDSSVLKQDLQLLRQANGT